MRQIVENKHQQIIVQGWTAMLLLLLTMFITDIVELAMLGDYKITSELLSKDPGVIGLCFIVFLICLNALVQIAVLSINTTKCRWFIFALTVSYGLFFFFHQITHLLSGQGIDVHFLLDNTHNIVASWTAWVSFQWAKITHNN